MLLSFASLVGISALAQSGAPDVRAYRQTLRWASITGMARVLTSTTEGMRALSFPKPTVMLLPAASPVAGAVARKPDTPGT